METLQHHRVQGTLPTGYWMSHPPEHPGVLLDVGDPPQGSEGAPGHPQTPEYL